MMTTHPEDAMTRERALEEAAQVVDNLAREFERRHAGLKKYSLDNDHRWIDFYPRIVQGCEEAAQAIRALASAQQEPAPSAEAENAWIEHIQSNNYDYEYEKSRSAFIAGFAAARANPSEKGGAR